MKQLVMIWGENLGAAQSCLEWWGEGAISSAKVCVGGAEKNGKIHVIAYVILNGTENLHFGKEG